VEASRAGVFQSSLKTGRGMIQMVHVASSQRSRGDESEDERVDVMGCIGLFYLNFVVYIILDHKKTLVISFPINRIPMVGGEVSIHPSLSPPHSYN
jgi:hypothetical protein